MRVNGFISNRIEEMYVQAGRRLRIARALGCSVETVNVLSGVVEALRVAAKEIVVWRRSRVVTVPLEEAS